MDAHEMSMSNSSDAFVGAAGMKPRNRGLSAEMTAGARNAAYTPSTWSGIVRFFVQQPAEREVEFGRIARALVQRHRIQPEPVLRVGQHGPDHLLGDGVD